MTNTISSLKLKVRFLLGTSLVVAALVVAAMPAVTYADTLYRQLELGMSGADVSSLQTFLASDPTIYPQGLVTGYFGALTMNAVSNFQTRNGIAAVGRVGPVTLIAINARMNGAVSTNMSGRAPTIANVMTVPGTYSATVNWTTDELAKAVVYYSTSALTTYERSNSVDVSGNVGMTDTNFRSSHSVSLSSLQANTTYYYMIYVTDQDGNVSVTLPSTFRTTN